MNRSEKLKVKKRRLARSRDMVLVAMFGVMFCASAAWAQDHPLDRPAIIQVVEVMPAPQTSQEHLSRAVAVRMVASILHQPQAAPAQHQLQVQPRSWFPVHLVPGWALLGGVWQEAQNLPVWTSPDLPAPELVNTAKMWTLQASIALRQAAPTLIEQGRWPDTHEMMLIAAGAERVVSAWAARGAATTTGAESAVLTLISKTTGAIAALTQWTADNYKTLDTLTGGDLDGFMCAGLKAAVTGL